MNLERVRTSESRVANRGIEISLVQSWERVALFGTIALATILNLYGLDREGYGNTYYAAAVKSMMQNWHAFFFNSLDSAGFVTIDKPPLGFWLQVASVKIFGFSGLALMLPQALAGIGSVALLYYLVARIFGKPAGLMAALVLALTPIAVVANRNNIVDGTLVFTVLLGAWAVTRAVETGRLRWLLLCALFVALGFNIKMLEAYLVVPAFGLMYLVGARISWGRRIAYLALTAVALIVVSLSWVTVVDLTPASQRPWVGSTTSNSALDLAIGYNGLQRLTGSNRVGGGRGPRPQAGSTRARTTTASPAPANSAPGGFTAGETGASGPLRLLNTQLGGQIGWLLPLAVIGLLIGAWQTRQRWPLSDKQLSLIMWGTWLLTMSIFFSVAQFFHTYYLVMMAPAIAALSGIGIVSLWQAYRERDFKLWWILPLSLLAVAAVQAHLLADYPDWSKWLGPLIIGLCLLGAILLVVVRYRDSGNARYAVPAVIVGFVALVAAPAAWAADSVGNGNSGLIPRAGPTASGGGAGFGSFAGPRSGRFRPPNGIFPRFGGGVGPPRGGFGGRSLDGGPQTNKGLLTYLEQHQGKATYLFATPNAGTAESYILATGKAVMAMGGFLGSDPILDAPKLAAMVKQGTVRYFLIPAFNGDGGFVPPGAQLSPLPTSGRNRNPGGFGGGRFGQNSAVTTWIQNHCTVVPVQRYSSTGASAFGGGDQLYDCARAR